MRRGKRLPEMTTGSHGRVVCFHGEEREWLRLMEMGILEGTRICLVRRAPLGDPLEVSLRGFHLSLRKSEAACIEVEEEES